MGADSAAAKLYVERDHRYVHHHTFWVVTKRVFDIVVATLGLVVAAPLFAAIAIAYASRPKVSFTPVYSPRRDTTCVQWFAAANPTRIFRITSLGFGKHVKIATPKFEARRRPTCPKLKCHISAGESLRG